MQKVILHVQIGINNRPLIYCEDDVEMPVPTPSMLIFGKTSHLTVEEPPDTQGKDLKKGQSTQENLKMLFWKRWESEYVRALRESTIAMHSGNRRN